MYKAFAEMLRQAQHDTSFDLLVATYLSYLASGGVRGLTQPCQQPILEVSNRFYTNIGASDISPLPDIACCCSA